MFRSLLELSRVSNIPTVVSNVLAAWCLAGGALLASSALIAMIVGGLLIYIGGMWLNDAADAAWDRQHKPSRVIPAGRIAGRTVWIVGIAMLGLGGGVMIGFGASMMWTLALLVAVLAYDLYHKPWAGSVLFMGACRTLLWVAAASPMGAVPRGVWIGGGLLGLYIVALTLMARAEGRGVLRPWARAGLTLLLLMPLLALNVVNAVSLMLGIAFALLIALAVRHLARGGAAVGEGVGWLLAGIPLVDALSLASFQPTLALVLAASVPLLRYWQRFVAAT